MTSDVDIKNFILYCKCIVLYLRVGHIVNDYVLRLYIRSTSTSTSTSDLSVQKWGVSYTREGVFPPKLKFSLDFLECARTGQTDGHHCLTRFVDGGGIIMLWYFSHGWGSQSSHSPLCIFESYFLLESALPALTTLAVSQRHAFKQMALCRHFVATPIWQFVCSLCCVLSYNEILDYMFVFA